MKSKNQKCERRNRNNVGWPIPVRCVRRLLARVQCSGESSPAAFLCTSLIHEQTNSIVRASRRPHARPRRFPRRPQPVGDPGRRSTRFLTSAIDPPTKCSPAFCGYVRSRVVCHSAYLVCILCSLHTRSRPLIKRTHHHNASAHIDRQTQGPHRLDPSAPTPPATRNHHSSCCGRHCGESPRRAGPAPEAAAGGRRSGSSRRSSSCFCPCGPGRSFSRRRTTTTSSAGPPRRRRALPSTRTTGCSPACRPGTG